MNIKMADLVLLVIGIVIGGLISWIIAHWYYKKNLRVQTAESERQINKLEEAIKEPNKAEYTLITQQYIDGAVAEWKRKGTPVNYLDSLDVPREEKAELYRSACLRHKGREPKRNPYKTD